MTDKEIRMLILTEMRLVEIQAAINFCNMKSGIPEKIKTPHWDDLEPAPRPRQEVIDYIKAITHQPCSCTHCQTRKQTLLWAFPGIEKEVEK
jgi:hypothetical protein